MEKALQERLKGEEVATIIPMQERGMRYGGNNDKELGADGSSGEEMTMHKYSGEIFGVLCYMNITILVLHC